MRRSKTHPKYYEYHELLKEAFIKIRKQGIIARMNFWCCSSCASYDLNQKLKKDPRKKGYVFWHNQDEESFKRTGTVFLGFGSGKDSELGEEDKTVAENIVKVLKEINIPYEWDGNPRIRIKVGNIIHDKD